MRVRAGVSALALAAAIVAGRSAGAQVVSGAASVAAPAAAPAATVPGPSVALDLTLDPAASRVAGHARLRVVNRTAGPLADVALWLYPNHLAARSKALGDVNYHWIYPGIVFSPGAMTISNARADGAPAPAALEDTPAGARTLARVTLPAPLSPGAATTIDLDFDTKVPRRLGAFGCDGRRCRLMGGFYPMPAAETAAGWNLGAAPARAGHTRVTLRTPSALGLVVNGQPVVWPGAAAAVTVESPDVVYPTIVTDRVFRVSEVRANQHLVRYLHRSPRPPDSEDQPLPYVREDITGLVLTTAARALQLVDTMLPADAARAMPVTLVEAPLRHQLVEAHGDVILVSDQLFRIFPIKRLRKYHRQELARAVLTAVVDAHLGASEPPEDRFMAAGVLADYLAELFAVVQFKKLEYAADLLRPFDFVPAVDQLIYAPLLAASSSYFGDVQDEDRVRDDVRLFADPSAPSPRLVYSKLYDLLGSARFPTLARKVLQEGLPLRRAAAETFGADLDWFWRQWLGPLPRVNYRLQSVRVTPAAGGGDHVEIEVRREGAQIREPVEVAVTDRDNVTQTLRWDDATAGHRFTVDLPAGLKSVEVDPRERLVETALGSLRPSDDPRYDNRQPARWRLLYEGFGALLNITALTANFEAAFLLKPQHDLRHAVLLTAYHTERTTIGAGGAYFWNFGQQADKNTLDSYLLSGLNVSRINPNFGLGAGGQPQPGYQLSARLVLAHDTRDFLFDPWHAVGASLAVGYALTRLDDGERLSQATAGAGALRLFELAPGHVLGLDVTTAATFGDIQLPVQLTDAGGVGGLRGYFPGVLLGRANAIGSIQLRDDYVADLAWDLLHLTTVRGFGGTLFADAAAVSSCDALHFSGDNVFYDVGYSFRVLHDAFGVYQQLLSIDVSVPLNRRTPTGTCLGEPFAPANPAFTFLISFFPSF
ncbi:MAG TPA: hypothetical protein VKZ18_22915 [Polyangia bacterium]|nr:hypothetical protein [Polyangia bacterium]